MAHFKLHLVSALTLAAVVAPSFASADPTTRIETVYVTGAIHDPANALYPKDNSANTAPALPVVYEKATDKKDGKS